jgi:hypothetical protein
MVNGTFDVLQNPNIVLEMAMEKANKPNGHAEVEVNGVKLKIDAPLLKRPTFFRIIADDGRHAVLGDCGTLTAAESNVVKAPIEVAGEPSWRQFVESDEHEQLAEADQDLHSARDMVDQDFAKLERLRTERKAYSTRYDGQLETNSAVAKVRDFERQIAEAETDWLESRGLEQHALNAFRETERRVYRAARSRMPVSGGIVESKETTKSNWRQRLRQAPQT